MATASLPARDMLPLLQLAIPSTVAYEQLGSVVQANAEGLRVVALHKSTNDGEDADASTELFIKQISAATYSKKPWPDLRRTLIYARTEARFYAEILPLLQKRGLASMAPKCFHVECNLHGLIDDDEGATDVNNGPACMRSTENGGNAGLELEGRGACMVLKSIAEPGTTIYYQESPLEPKQVTCCLSALAKLHAAAWEDAEFLSLISRRLGDKGGSYHLSVRNPKELEKMTESWASFMSKFEHLKPELFERTSIMNFGQRMFDMAEYVCKELSPTAQDQYATIVHGDFKSMNVFLPENDDPEQTVIIDYASCGLGLGMSDVAMLITHGVRPGYLTTAGEEDLLDNYLEALEAARLKRGSTVGPYAREVALRHYRLATVDYCRFILGRFWSSASPEEFEKKKDNRNVTLVNRNVEAAFAFIERADRYLKEAEEEKRVRRHFHNYYY